MARVPIAQGDGDVAERIKARRPGGALRPIDEVLLHSPVVADGWNTFIGVLRGATRLRADLRELAILRIAVLNAAPYEWASHEVPGREAGLRPDQLRALGESQPDTESFDEEQRAALRLTDLMTTAVEVPVDLVEWLSERLGVPQLVELVVTVAAYNMVSRLVVALDVQAPAGAR